MFECYPKCCVRISMMKHCVSQLCVSSAPVKPLRASDSTESLSQKPDGERCWNKVHQVPPIELYERIKGFAKLCHNAVSHSHTRLQFTTLTTEKNHLGAVVIKYNFICQMIHLNISTLGDENIIKHNEN